MINLRKLQKEVYKNKIKKSFNIKDINLEFSLTFDELAEAHRAYIKKKDDLGEELADVAIYLLGMAEILGIDLEKEILKKVEKNGKRSYKEINGVNKKIKNNK